MSTKYYLPKHEQERIDEIVFSINEASVNNETEVTFLTGLDGGLVGMTQNEYGNLVPVYSYEKMKYYLACEFSKDDNCEDPEQDAVEWLSTNTMPTIPYIKNSNGTPAAPIVIYETSDELQFDPDSCPKSIEIPAKFNDRYLRRLAIQDHINELTLIDEAIKTTKNSYTKHDESSLSTQVGALEYHRVCELADLYLLLHKEFADKDIIVQERVAKFKAKVESEK